MDQLHTMILDGRDSVAVALRTIEKGTHFTSGAIALTALDDIPAGHKIALRDHRKGSEVIKYGNRIGFATRDINAGSWIHSHNLATAIQDSDAYDYPGTPGDPLLPAEGETEYFEAFVRPDGNVGIRNELWIIPTVGCINHTASVLASWANGQCGSGAFADVDGAYAWTHPYGCSQLGGDLTHTQELLAALAKHPNAVGVLIVALGCENNTVDSFKRILGAHDPTRIRFLVCQEAEDEIAEGRRMLHSLARNGAGCTRTPVPLSRLVVGLKCGGSDSLSGITANPLVGMISDHIVRSGGSAVLTEIPELFGAEDPLLARCENQATFERLSCAIQSYKRYYRDHGQEVYENPSPGNLEGGITTLEEKSLGCVRKGGTAVVRDVIPYGGRVARCGLSIVESPGNDLVSSTALAAAGAHLILFTTGRGTPWGAAVPTVKIASNTRLATRKHNWIDFDAQELLRSDPVVVFNGLKDLMLAVASGAVRLKHEISGYRDIAIFKQGVTL